MAAARSHLPLVLGAILPVPLLDKNRLGLDLCLECGPKTAVFLTATLPVSAPRFAPGIRVLVSRPKVDPVGATFGKCRETCIGGLGCGTAGSRYQFLMFSSGWYYSARREGRPGQKAKNQMPTTNMPKRQGPARGNTRASSGSGVHAEESARGGSGTGLPRRDNALHDRVGAGQLLQHAGPVASAQEIVLNSTP